MCIWAHEGGTVSLQVGWDEYFGIAVVCGILGVPTVLPITLSSLELERATVTSQAGWPVDSGLT